MTEAAASPAGVAIVTGSAGGIGRETCAVLQEAGYQVVGVDRVDAAEQPLTDYCCADLAELGALPDLFADIAGTFGVPAVLVNNAAHLDQTPFADLDPASMVTTLTVNVAVVAVLCRVAAAAMRDAGGGVIVNVASIAGKRGSSQPLYGASKAGTISLTKTLARLYAPAVRVVGIAPALVEAGMGNHLPAEVRTGFLTQTPMKRGATAREIANVIAFLASPAASYVSGETVDIHGGL